MNIPDLFEKAHTFRLDNGLRVVVLPDSRVPLVATALTYAVGARDEGVEESGIAHFLEHMMFKGSKRYAPGEVDRRTQALGGSNNAFTSHDVTVYHFAFAADRWREAIEIEADRMSGLLLDSEDLESERSVILEEISMVEDDPWGRLEERVAAALFGPVDYGRPVLGTRESVGGVSIQDLARFHGEHYRPGNAVLSVVGDVDCDAVVEEAESHFVGISRNGSPGRRRALAGSPYAAQPKCLEDKGGEVSRLLMAFPAPTFSSVEHPAMRLALAVLATGRSSRLQRRLVEEGRLASWMSLDLGENEGAGSSTLALEAAHGTERERIEEAIRQELAGIAEQPPEVDELDRAKAVLRAEWILSHERLHQRAWTLGAALAFHDVEFPRRYRQRLDQLTADDVSEVAARWLSREDETVVGWSGIRAASLIQ